MRVSAIVILSFALLNTATSYINNDDFKKIQKLENEFHVTENDVVEEVETDQNGTELWDKKTTIKKFVKNGLPKNSEHKNENVMKKIEIDFNEDGSETIYEKDVSVRKVQSEIEASAKATSYSKSDDITTERSSLINLDIPRAKAKGTSEITTVSTAKSEIDEFANASRQSRGPWEPKTLDHTEVYSSGRYPNIYRSSDNSKATASARSEAESTSRVSNVGSPLDSVYDYSPLLTDVSATSEATAGSDVSRNNHNHGPLRPKKHHHVGPRREPYEEVESNVSSSATATSIAEQSVDPIGPHLHIYRDGQGGRATASARSEAETTSRVSNVGSPLDSVYDYSPLLTDGSATSEASAGSDVSWNNHNHGPLRPKKHHHAGPRREPYDEVESNVSSSATATSVAEQSVDSIGPHLHIYRDGQGGSATASARSEAESTSRVSNVGSPLDSVYDYSPLLTDVSATSEATAGSDVSRNNHNHGLLRPKKHHHVGPRREPYEEVESNVSSSATATSVAEQSVDTIGPYIQIHRDGQSGRATASARSKAESTSRVSNVGSPLDAVYDYSPLLTDASATSEATAASDVSRNNHNYDPLRPKKHHHVGPRREPYEEVKSNVSSSATATSVAEQSVDSIGPHLHIYRDGQGGSATASARSEAESTSRVSNVGSPLDSVYDYSPLLTDVSATSEATAGSDVSWNNHNHGPLRPKKHHHVGPRREPYEEVESNVSSSATATSVAEQSVDTIGPFIQIHRDGQSGRATALARSDSESTSRVSNVGSPLDAVYGYSPLLTDVSATSEATAGSDVSRNNHNHGPLRPKKHHHVGPRREPYEEDESNVLSSATATSVAEQSVDTTGPYIQIHRDGQSGRATASARSEAESTSRVSNVGSPLDSVYGYSPLLTDVSATSEATAGSDVSRNNHNHGPLRPKKHHHVGPRREPYEEVESNVSSSATATSVAEQSVDSIGPHLHIYRDGQGGSATASARSEAESTSRVSNVGSPLNSVYDYSPLLTDVSATSEATAGSDVSWNNHNHGPLRPKKHHHVGPRREPYEEVESNVSSSATATSVAEQSVDTIGPYIQIHRDGQSDRATASARSEAESTSRVSNVGSPLDAVYGYSPLLTDVSATSEATAGSDVSRNNHNHGPLRPKKHHHVGPRREPYEEVKSNVSSSATATSVAEQSVDSIGPHLHIYRDGQGGRATASARSEAESTSRVSNVGSPLDSVYGYSPLLTDVSATSEATAGSDVSRNNHNHGPLRPTKYHHAGPRREPYEEVESNVSSSATATSVAEQSVDTIGPYIQIHRDGQSGRATASARSEAESTSRVSNVGSPLDSVYDYSPLLTDVSATSEATAGSDVSWNNHNHGPLRPKKQHHVGPRREPYEEVESNVSSSATATSVAEQSVDSIGPHLHIYRDGQGGSATASARSEAESTSRVSNVGSPLDSVYDYSPLLTDGSANSEATAGSDISWNNHNHGPLRPKKHHHIGPRREPYDEVESSVSTSSATATSVAEKSVDTIGPYIQIHRDGQSGRATASARSEAESTSRVSYVGSPVDAVYDYSPLLTDVSATSEATAGSDVSRNNHNHGPLRPTKYHHAGPRREPYEEVESNVSSSATATSVAEQSVDTIGPYIQIHRDGQSGRATASARSEAESTSRVSNVGSPLDSVYDYSPLLTDVSATSEATAGSDVSWNNHNHGPLRPKKQHHVGPRREPYEEVESNVSSSATATSVAEQSVDSIGPHLHIYRDGQGGSATASARSEAESTSRVSNVGSPLDSVYDYSPLLTDGSANSEATAGSDISWNNHNHGPLRPKKHHHIGPRREPYDEVESSVSTSSATATSVAEKSVDTIGPYIQIHRDGQSGRATASARSEAESTSRVSYVGSPVDAVYDYSPLLTDVSATSEATAGSDVSRNNHNHGPLRPKKHHHVGPRHEPYEEVESNVSSSATATSVAEQSVDSIGPHLHIYRDGQGGSATASARSEAESTSRVSNVGSPLDSVYDYSPLLTDVSATSEATAESDVSWNNHNHGPLRPKKHHHVGPRREPYEEIESNVSSSATATSVAEQSVDTIGPYIQIHRDGQSGRATASARSEAESTSRVSNVGSSLDSVYGYSPLLTDVSATSEATAGSDVSRNNHNHGPLRPKKHHHAGPRREPYDKVESNVSSSATATSVAEQSVDTIGPFIQIHRDGQSGRATASARSEAESTSRVSNVGSPLDSVYDYSPLLTDVSATSEATAGSDVSWNNHNHGPLRPKKHHHVGPRREPYDEVESSVSTSSATATSVAEKSVDTIGPYIQIHRDGQSGRATASARSEAESTSRVSNVGSPLDAVYDYSPLLTDVSATSQATAGSDVSWNNHNHGPLRPKKHHHVGPRREPYEEVESNVSSLATATSVAEQSVDSIGPHLHIHRDGQGGSATASARSEAESTSRVSNVGSPLDSVYDYSPLLTDVSATSEASAGSDVSWNNHNHGPLRPKKHHHVGPRREPYDEVESNVSSSATATSVAEQSVDTIGPFIQIHRDGQSGRATASARSEAESTSRVSNVGSPLDSVYGYSPLLTDVSATSEASAGSDVSWNNHNHGPLRPKKHHRAGPRREPYVEVESNVSSSATATSVAEQSVDSIGPHLHIYRDGQGDRATASARSKAKSTSRVSNVGSPLDSVYDYSPLLTDVSATSEATAGSDVSRNNHNHGPLRPKKHHHFGPRREPYEEVESNVSSSATATSVAEQSVDSIGPHLHIYRDGQGGRATASARSEAESTSRVSNVGSPLDSVYGYSPLLTDVSTTSEATAGSDVSWNNHNHGPLRPKKHHHVGPRREPYEEVESNVSSSATATSVAEQSIDTIGPYIQIHRDGQSGRATASARSEAESTSRVSNVGSPLDAVYDYSPLLTDVSATSKATAGSDVSWNNQNHGPLRPKKHHHVGPRREPYEEVESNVSSSATATSAAEQSVDSIGPHLHIYRDGQAGRATASARSEAESTSRLSNVGSPLDSVCDYSPLLTDGSANSEAIAGSDMSWINYSDSLFDPKQNNNFVPKRKPYEEVGSSVSTSATATSVAEQSVDSFGPFSRIYRDSENGRATATARSEAESTSRISDLGSPLDSVYNNLPLLTDGSVNSEATARSDISSNNRNHGPIGPNKHHSFGPRREPYEEVESNVSSSATATSAAEQSVDSIGPHLHIYRDGQAGRATASARSEAESTSRLSNVGSPLDSVYDYSPLLTDGSANSEAIAGSDMSWINYSDSLFDPKQNNNFVPKRKPYEEVGSSVSTSATATSVAEQSVDSFGPFSRIYRDSENGRATATARSEAESTSRISDLGSPLDSVYNNLPLLTDGSVNSEATARSDISSNNRNHGPIGPNKHHSFGPRREPYEGVGSSVSSSATATSVAEQPVDSSGPYSHINRDGNRGRATASAKSEAESTKARVSNLRKDLRTQIYESTTTSEPDVIVIDNNNSEILLKIAEELAALTPPSTIIRSGNTKNIETVTTKSNVENVYDESSFDVSLDDYSKKLPRLSKIGGTSKARVRSSATTGLNSSYKNGRGHLDLEKHDHASPRPVPYREVGSSVSSSAKSESRSIDDEITLGGSLDAIPKQISSGAFEAKSAKPEKLSPNSLRDLFNDEDSDSSPLFSRRRGGRRLPCHLSQRKFLVKIGARHLTRRTC